MVAINIVLSGLLVACFSKAVMAASVADKSTSESVDGKDSSKFVGYLGIVFKDDTEQINAILSNGNNALDFEWLNGGDAVLTSHVGRSHTRDPFLVRDPMISKGNYIIATDNSLKAINNDFKLGNKFSSRKIVVYRSKGDSLVNWEQAYVTPDLMDERSGGVSAPEAIWLEEEKKFLVTFSSNQFPDASKTGDAGPSQIYSSYTTDFKTFTPAQPYFTIKNGGSVDMTIAQLTSDCFIRFFRNDTNGDLKVQGQISHNGINGQWKEISPTQQYIVTDNLNGGPLIFKDNLDPTLVHLWIDDFQLAYRAFETRDFQKGFAPSNAPKFLKGMKQGSITPVTKQEYDLIKNSKWAKK